MVQIIHISDFHLESNPITPQKEQLLEALVDDLKKQNVDFNNCLFVVSGDLIDKGGSSFANNTKEAFDYFNIVFVDRIINNLQIAKDQIFFVPGNHDVDRGRIDKIIENGMISSLTTKNSINDFVLENRITSNYLDRLTDYKQFEREFYQTTNLKKQLSNFDSCFITNNNIGIACLNSSWRSSKENEEGNLLIGESQILSSIKYLKDADVKIAIMHHPLEDLQKEDLDIIKHYLYKHFDILLIGHKHRLDIEFTRNFHGTLLKCQSNASIADFSDEKYTNGYSIVNFEKGRSVSIKYRKYLLEHEKFVANTDIGTDSDDGCITIFYPNNKQVEESKVVDKAIDTLSNVRFDNVDEHLFTYGLDESVPCKINDLFVEPIMSNVPETHSDVEDITYYHLFDFVRNTDNYLIYGLKESGKTTLLCKLMVEFTQCYHSGSYIPVYMKYNELSNRRPEQIIRNYLSISSEECRVLLKQNKIVLLIDDISFDDSEKRVKLIDFIEQNPNIRIIATKEQILENVLPTEFLDYNDIYNFNVVYIQSFKARQIKSLVKKWFPEQTNDYKKRINSLIKNFEALSLPRTPLAVTLFLWIIDKQEKNPINNAILVQQVVENLLEKTHFENVYQNKFTYQNKIRLLAFISREMEINGDENYSYRLKHSELLDFIGLYLSGKSDLKPQTIIDDFIKRGILAYNEELYIKFKFDFLFRYFLSLLINYDEAFRNKVFDPKLCMNYFDEIVYYSGLQTDDVKLLELSQQLLSSAYADLNNDVIQNSSKLDPFLNTKRALSNSLSIEKIKKKPTEEELEKMYDEELKNIPIKRSIEKRNISNEYPLDKTLKFAALVFRNLEDIDDQEARTVSLQNIITSTISLMLYTRDALIYYYSKNNRTPKGFPPNINFELLIRILPLLHQVIISDWVGTEKTKMIIKSKIDKHDTVLNISDFEKFIDIFTYSDIKGKDSFEKVEVFLKNTKYKYIKDLGVFKLILYYYMRSKSKESDMKYLNLISDLKIQLKQVDNKSEYIKRLSDFRRLDSNKSNE